MQGLSDTRKPAELVSPNMTGGMIYLLIGLRVLIFASVVRLHLVWCCSHVRVQLVVHAVCMGDKSKISPAVRVSPLQ